MVSKLKLKADKRKLLGRKVKKLRREGSLPANIYGKDVKSTAVKVDIKKFMDIYGEAGETGIVYLTVGTGKSEKPVLIHNLQVEPVTGKPLHADFHQVDLTKKVQVEVPIELVGESEAVNKGGVLVHLMDEVEVEALPTELPEKFEIDISKIKEIGEGISVKELKVDKEKVKLMIEDEKALIVMVQEPKPEEEEKPEPTEDEAVDEETAVEEEGVAEKDEEKESAKEGKAEEAAEATSGKPSTSAKAAADKPADKGKKAS
jgi:large subunit ribosomal protein L25